MAWIESHQELANHPKTKRFRRALNIGTAQAVGHLHMLWWWALDYAQDGCIACADSEDVAEACEWGGDAVRFIDALIQAGFLDADTLCIHDWDDYGAKYLKRRDQARERQQRHRSKDGTYLKEDGHALVTRDITVTHALVTPLQDKTREDKTREDKTREDKTTTAPAAPVRGYAPDFEAWWKRYPSGHGNKKVSAARWASLSVPERRAAEDGLGKWLVCGRWKRGMVKAAEIWLRDRWWEDTPPDDAAWASPPTNGRATAQDFLDLMHEDAHEPPGHGETVIDAAYSVSDGQALGTGGERHRQGVEHDAQRR